MFRTRLTRLALVSLVLLGLAGVFSFGMVVGAAPARASEEPGEFDVFWQAWNLVVENFVDRDKVDFKAMTYGAIRGMLETLDDNNHTSFFTPEEAEQQESALEGSFEGIGAYVGMENDVFRIIAPIHGSPAEAAGVLAGDIVFKVDNVEIAGLEEWEVISRIRGPAGTSVTLNVLHPESEEPVDITVERGKIEQESVLWSAIPGTEIAYLQISQFAEDTDKELKAALEAINASETPFQGILLDLRNNPGGYLHQAIYTGSQFLPEDSVILLERDAQGETVTHVSQGDGLAREIPMVVMVNPGTASAGEIVAGALQQNDRAILVGETTLGTGTVLRPYTLSDGSVLRLGVTNWLTPDEELLKDKGVVPDSAVKLDPKIPMLDTFGLDEMRTEGITEIEDTQFKSALLQLRLQLLNAANKE
jgi:carboxyl-terminal processing protease